MSKPPLSTTAMRAEYATNRCKPATLVPWSPYGYDGSVLVQPDTLEAWLALDLQMRFHRYTFDEIAGGTYSCRKIAGTSVWSLHSYGLAYDINPSRNPSKKPLTTDLPAALRNDIASIETAKSGRQVFMWGGIFATPDAMHFQIGATRAELAEGLTYPNQGETMFTIKGDKSPTVTYWQLRILRIDPKALPKWGADGDYGDETVTAVKALVPGSDGLQIGPLEAEMLSAYTAPVTVKAEPHQHGVGGLKIKDLDDKTLTGKTAKNV